MTIALQSAPDGMNPLAAVPTVAMNTVAQLAYETLVVIVTGSDEPQPSLASSWEVSSTSAAFTLRDDILCSDGSTVTPSVVAKSFEWVLDPDNGSAMLGNYVPADAVVTADDDNGTLTITTETPTSFLLEQLAFVPILCGSAADDPSVLTDQTMGTGLFQLSSQTVGQQYVFTRRDDYTGGYNGTTGTTAGVPKTVTLEVVADSQTTTNLLAAGEVDIATVSGDTSAVSSLGFAEEDVLGPPATLYFNQASGRVLEDQALRAALAAGIDSDAVGNVATGGRGIALTTLDLDNPQACVGDAVTGNRASFDVDAAAAALDELGWLEGTDGIRSKDGTTLTLKLLYPSNRGSELVSGVELLQQEWQALGVDVELIGSDSYASVLFGGGDWDVVWAPITVQWPSSFVGMFSGPTPAEGGMNITGASNAEYEAIVAEAQQLPSSESCDLWIESEASLIKNTDVYPIATNVSKVYGNGAEFNLMQGAVLGVSLRLLG